MHNIDDGSLLINTVMNDTQKPLVFSENFCYVMIILFLNIQAAVYLLLVSMKYILAKNNFRTSKTRKLSRIATKVSTFFTCIIVRKTKEIETIHRLFLVRISYCVGICRVKQKQNYAKVFTNLLRGFVDSCSGSCSK